MDTPHLAYSSWLSRQPLKESTKTVYLAMFGRFCQWLSEAGRRLDQVEAGDIGKFLDTANPNLPESRRHAQAGRQRQQYVRQLEKVFIHLATIGHRGTNPGRRAGYEKLGEGRDRPSRFLTVEERGRLIALIWERLEDLRREHPGRDGWLEYRDLALTSVVLGAGLKVGQIIRLTLNCINLVEGRIDLSLPNHAHRARILAFAMEPVSAWLTVLEDMHGEPLQPGQKIFEADRSAGFGRTSKTVTLSASSIHRRIQRLLLEAGISGERACAQTLRNTYAALLIDAGATDEHLVDFLGLQATVTAQRLRAAYVKSLPPAKEEEPTAKGILDRQANLGDDTQDAAQAK